MTALLLINGELVPGDADSTFDVINPSTGQPFNTAPHCSAAQAEMAVASAVRAGASWAATSFADRRLAMQAALAVFEANAGELAELLVREQGKPLASATGEVKGCLGILKEWAETLTEACLLKDVYRDDATCRVEVRRRPIGVIACITPWNFPLFCSIQKWVPAIMLGNTTVVKPSPFTPLTMLKVAELFCGVFPPGVLNVVSGDDTSSPSPPFNLGAFLSSHPSVAKVSFTGSIRTGKAIFASAATDVKRITLEMGGNDPAIVRADCDVAAAAQGVFDGAFSNTGQICCAIKRCYVHDSVYDAFCSAIAECAATALTQTMDGFEEGCKYGPLQNAMQFNRVRELVEDAKANGGE